MLIPRSKTNRIVLSALLLALMVSACGAQPTPTARVETLVQTVQVTVEVTSEVTRQVTSEVTRLVEVPVTITPSPTPDISLTPSLTASITRTPSLTPTPDAPVVTILVHAACYYGPGSAFLYYYGLNETSWMEVIGRMPSNPNTDLKNIWLWVQGVHGWNPCWVKNEFVRFNDGGDITTHPDIPIVAFNSLPYSRLYRGVEGVTAERVGTRVEILWGAMWMTEDDYRGYTVEAWLCVDGQLNYTPLQWFPPLEDNVGTMGIFVTDEPGCLVPSSARIYAVEKHGFTNFRVIPWPPYETSPTPTPTATP